MATADTVPPVAPKIVTDSSYQWSVDPQITMTTNYGTVVIELQPQQAPVTVANMLAYVNSGFYTDVIFHRVMSGFMIQAGLVGVSGNQYFIKSAIYSPINIESNNGLANLAGTIAMARTTDPNSASAQFFINQVDNAILNYTSVASPGYAVFGKVLSGMSVVNSISKVTTTSVNAGSQGTLDNFPNSAVLISSIQQTLSGSAFSSTGKLNVSDVEVGAHWDYTLNGGATWISGLNNYFTVPSGSYLPNLIEIRQTDLAGNISKSVNKLTSALIVDKAAPTFNLLDDSVTSGGENAINRITFAGIRSHSNALDADGEVTGFVVKTVSTGTLLIGTSEKSAIPWNVLTNNTIDANHQAYWKPDVKASGVLNAFTVVAQDNGGLLSDVAIQTTINVIAQSAAPVLTQPVDINYIDTKFDDNYSVYKGFLNGIDTPSKPLTYVIDGLVANHKGVMSLSNDYGILSLNTKTGAYIYKPDKAAIENLNTSAITHFTLNVSDGTTSDTKELYINVAQQGITESVGNDSLVGTLANDKFNSLAGNDTLDGGLGADTLVGGLGNDVYFVDNKGDKVIEKLNEGNDTVNSTISYTLPANVENLTLLGTGKINASGNNLDNLIVGNQQVNNINGGSGNDTLDGGAGSDVLTGGLGSDVFWFNSTPDALNNLDKITDFVSGVDKLQFSLSIFPDLDKAGPFISSDSRFISNSSGLAESNDSRLIYNISTGILYYDSDGASPVNSPIALEILGAHKVCMATDVFVV